MIQWLKEIFIIKIAQAGLVEEGLQSAAKEAEVQTEKELPEIIGNILNYVLSFVGVVLLIIVIYGGFLWMTAGGDEEKVGKARKLIINGAIGLAIILSSYAILNFLIGEG